jgi:hypothetical protein
MELVEKMAVALNDRGVVVVDEHNPMKLLLDHTSR